jgi:D-alanine transaminase
METVYLNGQLVDKTDAKISVLDRGFLFGDSIYEVIPLHDGHFIGCKLHFERMQRSLNALGISCPFASYTEFRQVCQNIIDANKLKDNCALYFQISRGAEQFRHHRIPTDTTPTVVGFHNPVCYKTEAELQAGFKAITHTDLRRDDNYIKCTALISNVSLYNKAHQKGAIETILMRNGHVLECTSSNLFIVKNNVLMTPPLSDFILAGITRHLVLQLAKQADIQVLEVDIPEALLREADEIWVTGSIKEICPVVKLDDQPVGTGQVGPVWQRLHTLYQHYKETHHD